MKTFWLGEWRVQPALNRIECGEEARHLEPRAMDLLVFLADHAGEVIAKDQLIRAVWSESFVTDGAVTYSVNQLRQKLGDDARDPRFIETIPRPGYRLIAEVVFEEPVDKDSHWPALAVRLAPLVLIAALVGALVWVSPWNAGESSSGPLKILPFTTDGGIKRFPSFSPDGERIAYQWDGPTRNNWDIYVKALGEGAPYLRLTEDPAEDRAPAWSPKGRYIAFTRLFGNGKAAIFAVPSLGGPERKLVDRSGDLRLAANDPLCRVSWSPDGSTLIYPEPEAPGRPARIVELSIETLEKKPLTRPPQGSRGDFAPSFSPDGSRIVLLREGSKIGLKMDIWIQERAGGVTRRLTDLDAEQATCPSWASDGDSIFFTTLRSGSFPQVWRFDTKLQKLSGVAGPGLGAGELSVSGDRLVFEQWEGYLADIQRVVVGSDPDSSAETLISSTAGENNADISPDGSEIVFESDRGGSSSIWKCRSDGSDPIQLTTFAEWCGTPRWSPDGSRIVFDSLHSGNWDLWVISREGGLPRQLTTELSDENMGTWSRDGNWIYFMSTRTGRNEIFKMPSNGGDAIQVTENGGYYALESCDGKDLYYSKFSEVGLWRLVDGAEGKEVRVLPEVRFRNWAIGRRGIYFASFAPRDYRVRFLDPGTGRITELYRRKGAFRHNDLTVSPDEEWLLFDESPWQESELMLVENFR